MAQTYLIITGHTTPAGLASVLRAAPVAAVRIAPDGLDEPALRDIVGWAQPCCADRDVPLVMGSHFRLAADLGLDGVHLLGTGDVRTARAALPREAIVGTFCGTSRHAGLTAGEMGADYVSFGPVEAGALGSGVVAPQDLFEWWADFVEVPLVAEGGLTPDRAEALRDRADFLAIGEEIWRSDDPVAALQALTMPPATR